MHWTAMEPGVTNWPDSYEPTTCDKLATAGSLTAIGMWGYMLVQITGVLVYRLLLIHSDIKSHY